MQIGAHGYLTKGQAEEVVNAIRAVNSGQRYIAPQIAQQIALAQFSGRTDENLSNSLRSRTANYADGHEGEGATSPPIKSELKTVNSYRYRIFENCCER